jgi:hypothetical protein
MAVFRQGFTILQHHWMREWRNSMGLLRGGIAGLGAWKLGGGCLSTIIIFLVLYWLLGFLFQ